MGVSLKMTFKDQQKLQNKFINLVVGTEGKQKKQEDALLREQIF